MADQALFIGWGEVVRGRERKAVEIFNESLQYYGGLQQDGKVERVEAWFLGPHGGDLAGFILCAASASSSTRFSAARSSSGSRLGRR